jgi:phosphoglycerol transferase
MEGVQRRPIVFKGIAAYLLAALLCLGILTGTLQLWKADLTVPMAYKGDALPLQAWIKGIVENGWYLHNGAIGAPAGQDVQDYPLMESVNFLFLKALTLFSSKSGEIYNLFFLLTFPLTTLSSLFVLRRFSLSYASSLVVSLLYTFLPYHFLRGMVGHLLLASYFLVPLVVLLAYWIYVDEPFLFQQKSGHWLPKLGLRNGKCLLAVLVCLGLSSTGAYYALFGGFLLLVAGMLSSWRHRRLAPLSAALLLDLLLVLGAAANAVPCLVFRFNHGANPLAVQRSRTAIEIYSLKLTDLLLPTTIHRVHALARYKARYAAWSPIATADFAYLGVIGALGFLMTLGRLSKGDRHRPRSELQDGLGACLLAALLLATTGGLASILTLVLGSWIRCYERISIYVAYLSLCEIALFLHERVATQSKGTSSRLLHSVCLGGILALGLLDQTSPQLIPPYACLRDEYNNDADFVQRVEETVPERALIFQLPYVAFPESLPVHRMTDYDHLRPYLHSRTLRWSYGAMRGRAEDAWQSWVSAQPVEQMVRVLAERGFAGIYVDRFGFPDQGVSLESQLVQVLGGRPIVSNNQRMTFFSMAEYREHAQPVLAKRDSTH